MKGEITLHILEKIGEGMIDAAALLGSVLEAGYGASYRKLERVHQRSAGKKSSTLSNKVQKQRYRNMLASLKRDGLLESIKKDSLELIHLTPKGSETLKRLKNKPTLPSTHYNPTKETRIVIVTFDIPEKERRKRDWLRMSLKNLELRMVHKSVWMGKTKLPQTLLEDIYTLRLTQYVEVFEITKKGTLSSLL